MYFAWPIAAAAAIGFVLSTTPSAAVFLSSSSALRVPTSTSAELPTETSSTTLMATSTVVIASSTVPHVPLPAEVRGLYWTVYTAGSQKGKELLDYMTTRGLNTAVVDLKADNGQLGFVPNNPDFQQYALKYPAIGNLDELLDTLRRNHIYRIARIFIMRDGAFGKAHPEFTLQKKSGGTWVDKTGTPWLDPAATPVADYAVALGKEAYARGFDEVEFDYVRFPSDGELEGIVYPVYDGKQSKVEVMQDFFDHVGGAMKEASIPVSFDLFGMTFLRTDDFGIGQRLQDVLPNANFVSPMAYPSHYPKGFEGFANPATHPYDVVKTTLESGVKLEKLVNPFFPEKQLRQSFRPWIQDFDIGAVYTAPMIEAQIKAARDAGASGWLIWNARNVYEPANYK